MKKNLFIDTNVYLTFYSYTNETLNELKKIIALVNSENINLYLPEQTKNEFYRNREVKISDSLSKLKDVNMNNQFPMICHSYEEYEEIKNAIKQFNTNKSKLQKKIQHDAEKGTLLADDILNQIIEKAINIQTNQNTLNSAIVRFDVGNPPGKDKSYGDAINWECLLSETPNYEDLYFISEDKDYYSKLNNKNFNEFLSKEWNQKKNSKIVHYKTLSSFIKEHYPNIEITEETEKELVIRNLHEAYSYDNAKSVSRKLLTYNNFSTKQLNEITKAFTENNQIYWIKNDYGIYDIRKNVIEANKTQIDEDIYNKYEYAMSNN